MIGACLGPTRDLAEALFLETGRRAFWASGAAFVAVGRRAFFETPLLSIVPVGLGGGRRAGFETPLPELGGCFAIGRTAGFETPLAAVGLIGVGLVPAEVGLMPAGLVGTMPPPEPGRSDVIGLGLGPPPSVGAPAVPAELGTGLVPGGR